MDEPRTGGCGGFHCPIHWGAHLEAKVLIVIEPIAAGVFECPLDDCDYRRGFQALMAVLDE